MGQRLKKWIRLLALALVLGFVAVQFIPVAWPDKTAGQEIPAPPEIRDILRTHCYDCHSSNFERPWYAHVAPVSWWIAYDVNHGVSRLDFADWESETPNSAMYKIAHTGHRIRDGKGKLGDWMMPPASYVRLGYQRELTKDDLNKLLEWAGRHGMNLDVPPNALRQRKATKQDEPWPYVAAVGSLSLDSKSELDGTVLKSIAVAAIDLTEFDPLFSSHSGKGEVLVGLHRVEKDYLGETGLDHALLFVGGNVRAKLSGRGAVVAGGDIELELPASQPVELLVVGSGKVSLTGGGEDCRLAVVSPSSITMKKLKARGAVVTGSLVMQNSSFAFDPGSTRNELALPPSQRDVLTYCDQDGEMAESDRRLEVLYDAGTFTLHDPEYDITKQASSPGEAYQSAEEILAADPSMDLTRMQRKGFDKGWLRRFEELSSQQSNTTTLQFNLADWVIE